MNNQDYVHSYEDAYANSKVWNRVTCCVDLENLLIKMFFSGNKLENVHLPPDFVPNVLDSKGQESAKELTFTNYSNGRTFRGYVDNLRVFGWALEDEDVLALSFEHPLGKRDWRDIIIWIIAGLCFLLLVLMFYLKKRKWEKQ